MPNPEKWIRSAIEDATDVPAYPLDVPESIAPPFVVYSRTDTLRERQLDGVVGHPVGTFNVEIYADGFDAVKALADQVRTALHDFNGQWNGLIIETTDLTSERDGSPVYVEGREKPTYLVEHVYSIRWQE